MNIYKEMSQIQNISWFQGYLLVLLIIDFYPIVHSAYMMNASDDNGEGSDRDQMMMNKMMPVSRVISTLMTK